MFKKILTAFLAVMLLSSPALARPHRGGPVIADRIRTTKVSRLPPQAIGRVLVVTDGSTTTDCSVGGGSNKVICWHNGTAWTNIGSGGSTDLTIANSWTVGDGSTGDVTFNFDGDAGVDGSVVWDVSEDAFNISRILKLFADSGVDSGGEVDDTGDMAFDISHWDTGRGTILIWDGTALSALIGIQISDTCNDGERPNYNSGGTWTCEPDQDTGAPTIADTLVAYATAANTIGGEAAFYYDDATNTLFVDNITLAASETPTATQYDSDTIDGDASCQQVVNCTDTGSGTEDCDWTLSCQVAGVMTAKITVDADGVVTTDIQDASKTVEGDVELATVAEIDAATDAGRVMAVDDFNASDWGVREVQVIILDDTTALTVADGLGDFEWTVPTTYAGWDIVDIECGVFVAGTTGTQDFQIHNVTSAADILTTKCTIDSTELNSFTAATAPVISATEDDLTAGDRIRFDSDAIQTTAAQGAWVNLTLRKP